MGPFARICEDEKFRKGYKQMPVSFTTVRSDARYFWRSLTRSTRILDNAIVLSLPILLLLKLARAHRLMPQLEQH